MGAVTSNNRLVTFVLITATVIFTSGTGAPGAVGVPPVQRSVRPPTSSASPSPRRVSGTRAFTTNWKGESGTSQNQLSKSLARAPLPDGSTRDVIAVPAVLV